MQLLKFEKKGKQAEKITLGNWIDSFKIHLESSNLLFKLNGNSFHDFKCVCLASICILKGTVHWFIYILDWIYIPYNHNIYLNVRIRILMTGFLAV